MTKYNKLWVALSGVVAQAIAQGLINGNAAAWVSILIGSITAAGVFAAKNGE